MTTLNIVRAIAPPVIAARSNKPGWIATLRLWLQRSRERAELATLSEYELWDFGASRTDALMELDKPFWRA